MMHRRAFLGAAVASFHADSFARTMASPDVAAGSFPGMIIREREPLNLEFPFSSLDSWLVPNGRFYVRNHFAAPRIDTKSWRLKVEGAVERPLALSIEDIRKMRSVTRPLTLECAGNGRVYLVPKVRGVQWQLGAVGNADWTGIPLVEILSLAGVKASAVEIILEGADRGTIIDDPKSPGPIAFARSLPIEKAKKPEVLLAYEMNGSPLPVDHGAPLRAAVGGWYGMASVKWLTRIVAVERPFTGFWQTFDYSVFRRENDLPVSAPITEMQIKASIARPVTGETIPQNRDYRVFGAAWSGENPVARVEVSTDGGKNWLPAKLFDREAPFAWRLWEYTWKKPQAGPATLMTRAADSRGQTQPISRDPDRRTYVVNHMLPVEVDVK
jgi:DMSO/TMAO reductase YedYZ molybdopterin-dependent catalytic subunit